MIAVVAGFRQLEVRCHKGGNLGIGPVWYLVISVGYLDVSGSDGGRAVRDWMDDEGRKELMVARGGREKKMWYCEAERCCELCSMLTTG